jgi:hypothetical protein
MAGSLTTTSFSSGAKDAAATVDVYAKSSNTVINSIQDIRTRFDTTKLSSMRGGDFSAAMGSVVRGIDAAGLVIDKSALIGRVIGSNSGLLAGFKDLSSKVGDGILGAFDEKDGVFASIGGVISKVSSSAVADVKALGSLISDVAGDAYDFVVKDNDGLAGLYTGIINEATALGIPNSFGGIVSAIRDPNIINRVAGNILPAIVGGSDTAGLLGVAAGTAQGVLKAVNPQLLNDFSRNYTNPAYNSVRDLQSEGSSIFRAFDAVDNGWDKASRLGSKITDITTIQGASPAAKSAIGAASTNQSSDDSKDRSMYSLANVFSSTSVADSLKSDFSAAAFSPAITTTPITYQAPAKADSRLTDNPLQLTGLAGYKAEKAKQDAYSTDMNLFEKVKNIYF